MNFTIMPIFTPKKISPKKTIGEQLQEARIIRYPDIELAAKKVKIKSGYLQAMEDNRFDKLPAGLYGKSFLKQYIKFLGLKSKTILQDVDYSLFQDKEAAPFAQKIIKSSQFMVWPKIIRNILAFGAVLICFLYLIFYFKNIVSAPDLTITYPDKNILIQDNSLTIRGRSEPEAEIRINGETVLNNNQGDFFQDINLKKGLNSVTITAKKKYSRENTIIRQILVE